MFFPCIQSLWVYFLPCFTLPTATSTVMLKSDENQHFCLVPNIRGEHFQCLAINLTLGFLYIYMFYQIKEVLFHN